MYQIFENAADNERIHRFFAENQNYKVVQADGPSDTVCIFFSSNSLFSPNTYSAFQNSVIEKDRYEWENLAKNPEVFKIAGTFVFVRDVYKNWWIEGLNGRYNTQSKMLDLMRDLTAGKRVLTVGNSAGGYAAILFGVQLGAERIYAFSAQINLHIYNTYHPIKYYSAYLDERRAKAELELLPIIRNYQGKLYFFYPCLCQEDIDQARYLSNEKPDSCHMLPIRRRKHGSTVLPISILKFLSMPATQVDAVCQTYHGKQINPYDFLFRTSGFLTGIKYLVSQLVKVVIKRLR